MDKQQLIQKVKQLTGEARLEEALKLLDEYTASQADTYEDLHDLVVQARALFSRTQKDQSAGVISFENAKLSLNQVTQQILTILDELEVEVKAEATGHAARRKRPSWVLPLVLIAVVLTIGGAYFFYRHFLDDTSGPDKPQALDTTFCSGFEGKEKAFRVLVLPYLPLKREERPLRSHLTINLRLQELRDMYRIDLASEVYQDSSLLTPGRYPFAADQASALATNCNAQFVIWGTEEVLEEGSSAARHVILTKYKLLAQDSFDLTKLQINNAGALDTISSLSSILTQGAVTGEVEQVIKYLFGLIEFQQGDYDQAIASLEEAQVTDSTAMFTKSMLLSDSYLKKGNEEMALKSLDAALKTHPEYALALNNRAAINYRKKNYEAAAVDLEMANALKPEDTTIVANRLFTGLVMERVYVAREAVEKLSRIAPGSKEWVAKKSTIDSIHAKQDNVIAKTNTILESDRNNVQALQLRAQAYLNQGAFDQAISTANAILRTDRRNKTAYLILLEAYRKLGREEDFQNILKQAERSGLTRDSLMVGRTELIRVVKPLSPVN